jgi:hypothetical protein
MLVLRADGSEEFVSGSNTAAIRKAIGAKSLDFVNLRRDGLMMAVDDDGWESQLLDDGGGRFELKPVRPRRPLNRRATELYWSVCVPGTNFEIAGDVAIVHDGDRTRRASPKQDLAS